VTGRIVGLAGESPPDEFHGFVSTKTITTMTAMMPNTTKAMMQFILQFLKHIFFLSFEDDLLKRIELLSRSSERDCRVSIRSPRSRTFSTLSFIKAVTSLTSFSRRSRLPLRELVALAIMIRVCSAYKLQISSIFFKFLIL